MKFNSPSQYLEFLTGGLELRFFNRNMVINLITKNDVMYANDYVKKSFYKETEKVLVEILTLNK